MDLASGGPAHLAEQRLRWLDARQRVLAANIANADTPGYRPRDLRPFAQRLAAGGAPPPPLARTAAGHLAPSRAGTGAGEAAVRRLPERAPNGNAVALDREALKVAETDQAHALATGLRRKYLDLFRATLGRP